MVKGWSMWGSQFLVLSSIWSIHPRPVHNPSYLFIDYKYTTVWLHLARLGPYNGFLSCVLVCFLWWIFDSMVWWLYKCVYLHKCFTYILFLGWVKNIDIPTSLLKRKGVWSCLLRNGGWSIKFLGSCDIYAWVVWAKLCAHFLCCRIFQHNL